MTQDADFITTGLTGSKGAHESSSFQLVANRSVSPAHDRAKLVPNSSPRSGSTEDINLKPTLEVKTKPAVDFVAGPSTSSRSPEEPMNQEDCRSSSSVDETEGLNVDDNDIQPGTSTQAEVEKREKRNPVAIHDHVTVLGRKLDL